MKIWHPAARHYSSTLVNALIYHGNLLFLLSRKEQPPAFTIYVFLDICMASRPSSRVSEVSSLSRRASNLSRGDIAGDTTAQREELLPSWGPQVDAIPDHVDNSSGSPRCTDPVLSPLSSKEKLSRPSHSFYDHTFTNGWAWEFLAWLLAALLLLALVIVFVLFNDKPLGQWNSRLAPNTIVSVLSQVGHTAVLVPVVSCMCRKYFRRFLITLMYASVCIQMGLKDRCLRKANEDGLSYDRTIAESVRMYRVYVDIPEQGAPKSIPARCERDNVTVCRHASIR